jgi:hypothetical protein
VPAPSQRAWQAHRPAQLPHHQQRQQQQQQQQHTAPVRVQGQGLQAQRSLLALRAMQVQATLLPASAMPPQPQHPQAHAQPWLG